jgi:Uma2 family endonuclease
VLNGVPWSVYVALRDALDDQSSLKMTYLKGTLELMSPSTLHEDAKTIIARLLETWAMERDLDLRGFGGATFRREAKERGLEPDECYCVGSDMLEVPEIALEVVVTSGGINKLAVYQGLGVREVWFWKDERFELYTLGEQGFRPLDQSALIPQLDFAALARFALHADQHQALVEYRAFLRGP